MTEGALSSEEDRRALLGVYSSGVLQFAGLALASGAATLGDFGLFIQSNGSAEILRALTFAIIPPTIFLTLVFADAYLVQRGSIVIVLRHPLPTEAELTKVREDSKSLFADVRDVKISNGLDVLDTYYTGLDRIKFRKHLISRLIWLGPEYVALVWGIVFVFLLVLFPLVASFA